MNPYVRVLQTYMIALGKSDYTTIKSLFAPGGLVKSPFLGEMSAELFFDRLGEASAKEILQNPPQCLVHVSMQWHPHRP